MGLSPKPNHKRIPLADVNASNLTSNRSNKVYRQHGNKPMGKTIYQRAPYKLPRRVKRTRVVRTIRQKLKVVLYFMHHRLEDKDYRDGKEQKQRCLHGLEYDGWYRPPTLFDAADWFKIPMTTAYNIWATRHTIVAASRSSRVTAPSTNRERYPELELELFRQFVEWRQMGRKVSRYWFHRRGKIIFDTLYGHELDENGQKLQFQFSNGWFKRFLGRWDISWRRLTHASQHLPPHYLELVNRFLRFIRRNSLVRTSVGCYWRFQLSNIINMDEVPIPFEFFDGCTYHLKGEHTVTGNVTNSSWAKRQATLILYVFADGVPRLKPKLIFHGVAGGELDKKERVNWDPRVTVEVNPSAYNNEELLVKWLDKELFDVLEGRDSLLVMDHAAFHKTEVVKAKLREKRVCLAMIPGGCTGLLQPLDVSINKSFKASMREKLELLMDNETFEETPTKQTAISARRIAVTRAVADAWDDLNRQKRQLIKDSFVHTGIAVSPIGTDDHLIKIKDFVDKVDFTGWEISEDSAEDLADVKIEELDDDVFAYSLPEDEGETLARQEKSYKSMLVPDLKRVMKSRLIPGGSRMNKARLIERLLAEDAKGWIPSNPIIIDGAGNSLGPPELAERAEQEEREEMEQQLKLGKDCSTIETLR